MKFYQKVIEIIRYILLLTTPAILLGKGNRFYHNMDYFIGRLIIYHLKRFRSVRIKKNNFPLSLESKEEWIKVLNDMIEGFEFLAHTKPRDYTKFGGDWFGKYKNDRIIAIKKSKLFVEYFNSLWY